MKAKPAPTREAESEWWRVGSKVGMGTFVVVEAVGKFVGCGPGWGVGGAGAGG